jgi:hypothetical protein
MIRRLNRLNRLFLITHSEFKQNSDYFILIFSQTTIYSYNIVFIVLPHSEFGIKDFDFKIAN